jgi:hypothetical protein
VVAVGEMLRDGGFQGEAGMVGSEGDAHDRSLI